MKSTSFELESQTQSLEIWKPIESSDLGCEVSSLGRVRNSKGKIIAQRIRNEYPSVVIKINGSRLPRSVHTLVADAFLEKPSGIPGLGMSDYCVAHKDFDPTNNRWTNLMWLTRSENHDRWMEYKRQQRRRLSEVIRVAKT